MEDFNKTILRVSMNVKQDSEPDWANGKSSSARVVQCHILHNHEED